MRSHCYMNLSIVSCSATEIIPLPYLYENFLALCIDRTLARIALLTRLDYYYRCLGAG